MTYEKSWFWLHDEQRCEQCSRPAHIGGLCGFCFAGADAVTRAIALLMQSLRAC